jgi:Putative metal-binding motif
MKRRASVVAAVAALVLAAPAVAAVPHGNLLQNAGAEDQSMAHWSGTVLPLNYGFENYPSRAIGDQYAGGCYFFSSGAHIASNASSSQSVDLRKVTEIAGGNVVATLSGYLGGFETQEDNARLEVGFLDHDGGDVGNPIVIGPVTAADRGGKTNLLHRLASGTVPMQATAARVTIVLTNVSGGATDGYADNLSLSLDGSAGTAPATACLPDRDRDGYSIAVDCNDANPLVHPGAPDVPDDRIDQDCSGADAVNLDRDGDGYNRPQDCNDQNASVHPNAVDTPRDGIDQNCDLADARFPHLTAKVGMSWSKSGRGTRVDALKIRKVPAAAAVRVTCKGRRCAFRRKAVKRKKGAADAGRLFKGRFLGKGTVVTVVISQAGHVGQAVRYTMRKPKKDPRRKDLCTAPGSLAPRSCSGL